MGAIFSGAVKLLFRKKVRTILTIAGIMIGVASVIIINNIGHCGNDALISEIDNLGMGGLSVMSKNNSAPLSENELDTIQSLSCVSSAMPLMFESCDAYIHRQKSQIYLWGIDKSAPDVVDLQLVRGRMINAGDISSADKVCLIDKKMAESCYGTDNIVGKRLTINSGGSTSEYRIAGVVKTGSGILESMMDSYIPSFMYIPYTTLRINLGTSDFTQIAVRVERDFDDEAASETIIRTLERTTGYKGGYMVTNLSRQKESIRNIIDIFTLVLSCIGAVSLFVAGLSIMNVMLVSVNERKREIGIKKAIGAKKSMIVLEFMSEAVIITLLGSAAGIVLGTIISWAGASLLGLTITPGIDIMLITTGFALIVGVVFGIYPAFKASQLRPVEALRSV